MTTQAEPLPCVRAAFTALIDYAGLFPPAALSMQQAVAEYAAARKGAHAWVLGRFIVPASRLDELLDVISRTQDAMEPIAASIIVDAARDPRLWFETLQTILANVVRNRAPESLRVEALEIPLPPLLRNRETHDAAIGQCAASLAQSGLQDIPSFVELPRDSRWEEHLPGSLFALSRHRLGGKIRCGGVTADAFPTVPQIAAFVLAAAAEGVRFKATAGLHHPVRARDAASGFAMHGFLNVLAATAFAVENETRTIVETALADMEPAHFRFAAGGFHYGNRIVSTAALLQARTCGFVAYGSCSFAEPIDDLRVLGILEPPSGANASE